MNCLSFVFLGTIHRAPDGALVSARDRITSLGFLGSNVPLPMRGCALFAELTVPDTHEETAPLTVSIDGPHGHAVLGNDPISFGAPHGGIRGATVTVPLDPYAFPLAGDYEFRLESDGVLLSSIRLEHRILSGEVIARFSSFVQDIQGISGEDRYLSARFPFALLDRAGAFGGYHLVQLTQREGDNFEVDALELRFAPGGETLANVYPFRVAAHRAYEFYAKRSFGGALPPGSVIRMSNNLIQEEHSQEFTLPDNSSSAGW